MRIALDTNILIYAEGFGDQSRIAKAVKLVGTFGTFLVVPAQAIGETYNVLTRKLKCAKVEVLEILGAWMRDSEICLGSSGTMVRAINLASDRQLQIWDAFIVECALEAGCKILLSEDMQHGFYWNGLTIINPFIEPVHPLLINAIDLASRSIK
jgi:predicted nucleic acid-binding protein